ncbi:hypothetical protein [Desulfobacter vibrioformis]|uniref:hypothetical protein n=1 Tax=Desulfobacter vibrioformis TaxID=34031 RepID=UPI0005595A41|nr:hypothetical protein [Desulfobacter vibrioformis]
MMRFEVFILLAAILMLGLGVITCKIDRSRNMEREIACLRVRVDALQMVAAGECPVPEFDVTPVKRPVVIKY